MSNFIYNKTKESILNGNINMSTADIRVLFLKDTYFPNVNFDEYILDIAPEDISQRSIQLQNVTNILGVIDADDLLNYSYNGHAFKALALYENTGSDSTSRLIAYIDTSVGLPFSGSEEALPLSIIWDNGINKIISIQ